LIAADATVTPLMMHWVVTAGGGLLQAVAAISSPAHWRNRIRKPPMRTVPNYLSRLLHPVNPGGHSSDAPTPSI
jgi:hypothetical protein